jgi:hypothetical protein
MEDREYENNADYERQEAQAIESLDLTLGIKEAGSWEAYKRLRDAAEENK